MVRFSFGFFCKEEMRDKMRRLRTACEEYEGHDGAVFVFEVGEERCECEEVEDEMEDRKMEERICR